MTLTIMDNKGCIDVLSSNHIAHLACVRDNRPYVVPIQYAFDPRNLYIFSMPGQKIDWLRDNPKACVQVTDIRDTGEWRSVVVDGDFEEYPDGDQWHDARLHAWSLLEKRANWWEPGSFKPEAQAVSGDTLAPVFFSVRIGTMSGRHSIPDAA
ncbi:pyridoxamine 5'-phosphate oxidase family protein [Pararhizobium gei]|uniref:pyridoxamine 5'-phosphate oxidase family protein n=1 Tax=Pararhizobium gei TaxID=1395951 RepID=UPI0023DCAA04|nr:pyridoxamine 5'-phosphate oxidase family protein [Rhizobium gei]